MEILTREEIALLPMRQYEGPILLIQSHQELAQAMQTIRSQKVVGVDTETRPAFRKGTFYLPALVQIATASVVCLFQLQKMDFSKALTEILEDPHLIKTGIGLANDFTHLKKLFPFEPQNLVDLSLVAQAHGFKQSGVRSLAGQLLGCRISKSTATSNWAQAQLTPKQISYAATDAWVCHKLFLRFQKLNFIDPQGRPILPTINPADERASDSPPN